VVDPLNAWEVSLNPKTGHWAIALPVATGLLADNAQFTFLKEEHRDPQGHRYYAIASDLEADDYEGGKLACWHLKDDHFAWIN
jgi:hypothetical protein